MRVHFIAIGGAAMHNIALALNENGHEVSGSDDEIFEPSKSRLERYGLLPEKMGWNADRITADLDAIVLGMHAKIDNSELIKAQDLGIKIYSFPSFIAEISQNKKRIVIAGSHGKTTTTSMVMHVLKFRNISFDYMVGASIEGFDLMARFSDAPLIILEGDEYLSSALDRRPKMLHYQPHIAIITGVSWDHINVFPSYDNYLTQFDFFSETLDKKGTLFYDSDDANLCKLMEKYPSDRFLPYEAFEVDSAGTIQFQNKKFRCSVFGKHNMANMKAAFLICQSLGVRMDDFFAAMSSFKGASRRLETIQETKDLTIYLDFAHAPSKVKASTKAVIEKHPNQEVIAILELHTFSSLNLDFIPLYKDTLTGPTKVILLVSKHALKMKQRPEVSDEEIKNGFNRDDILYVRSGDELQKWMDSEDFTNKVLLFMSSGNFDGVDIKNFFNKD